MKRSKGFCERFINEIVFRKQHVRFHFIVIVSSFLFTLKISKTKSNDDNNGIRTNNKRLQSLIEAIMLSRIRLDQ